MDIVSAITDPTIKTSLVKYSKALTKNSSMDWEDLVQDTIVKMIRSPSSEFAGKQFVTWMLVVCRNIHSDHIRKIIGQGMIKYTHVSIEYIPEPTQEPNQENVVFLKQLDKHITDKYARMYFIEDMSYDEISVKLNCKKNQPIKRVYDQRQRLHKLTQEAA